MSRRVLGTLSRILRHPEVIGFAYGFTHPGEVIREQLRDLRAR